MDTPADVGAAVLGLITMNDGTPGPVLTELVESVHRFSGLPAGAATLSEGAVHGVVRSGPAQPLEALSAGFGQGPGGECARTGRPVLCPDLRRERSRWLVFTTKAIAAGVGAAWALPVRRGDDTLGALLLLGPGAADVDLRVVEVLVEAAAVSLLRAAAAERTAVETSQLRTALTSRVLVEQAKGMLAAHGGVDVGTAFACMRSHARRSGRPLRDLAAAVVHRDIDPVIVLRVDT